MERGVRKPSSGKAEVLWLGGKDSVGSSQRHVVPSLGLGMTVREGTMPRSAPGVVVVACLLQQWPAYYTLGAVLNFCHLCPRTTCLQGLLIHFPGENTAAQTGDVYCGPWPGGGGAGPQSQCLLLPGIPFGLPATLPGAVAVLTVDMYVGLTYPSPSHVQRVQYFVWGSVGVYCVVAGGEWCFLQEALLDICS